MKLYIIRHGQTEWNSTYRLQGRTNTELNENGRRLAVETGRGLADIPFDLAYTSPLARAKETARLVLDGQNGRNLQNSAGVQNGGHMQAGASVQNGGHMQAGASVQNGGHMQNSAGEQNGAHMQNSTGKQNGGHMQNSAGEQNGAHMQNSTGEQNGAHMQNSANVQKEVRPAAIPIVEENRLLEISFGVMEGQKVRDDNGVLVVENFIRFFNDPERYLPPDEGESFQSLLGRTEDFLKELKQKGQTAGGEGGSGNILISTHGAASRALLANITHCPLRDFWSGGVPENCAVTIVDLENGEWKIKEQDVLFAGTV